MSSSRYTLSIQTATSSPASSEFTQSLSVDIRKLIPLELRNSKFLLKTSFYTGNLQDANHGGLAVYLGGLPRAYNKSAPETQYTRIGTARPFICSADTGVNSSFSYSFSENECIPVVIDYPEISTIDLFVSSYTADDIDDDVPIDITLAFETLDK